MSVLAVSVGYRKVFGPSTTTSNPTSNSTAGGQSSTTKPSDPPETKTAETNKSRVAQWEKPESITFAAGVTTLNEEHRGTLKKLAEQLKSDAMLDLEVWGYALQGDDEQTAQDRAKNVRAYLLEERVTQGQVTTIDVKKTTDRGVGRSVSFQLFRLEE